MKTITSIIYSLILLSTASCQEVRKVKVTVTEDDGTPIEAATANVIFLGYGNDGKKEKSGLTDTKGFFETSGASSGRIHVDITKKGYYQTKSDRLSRKGDHDVTYVLRKVIKPIPLCAKRLEIIPPVQGESCAYDFEAGDWVEPHGKGVISDIIFKDYFLRNNSVYEDFHYKIDISFPNENDGMLSYKQDELSNFKAPYYRSPLFKSLKASRTWTYSRDKKPNKAEISNREADRCYYMRIRTNSDAKGNVISANYVKIYGDFPDIKYYFNPSANDRNLEFDITKNLFKDLEVMERVQEP